MITNNLANYHGNNKINVDILKKSSINSNRHNKHILILVSLNLQNDQKFSDVQYNTCTLIA